MRPPISKPIDDRRRYAGISWAPVLFLLSFLAAIGVMAWFWLEPVLRIATEGTHEQRIRLAAYSALTLAILVLVLLVGLVLTIRIGRRLRLLGTRERVKTDYPDAWEESARRTKPPTVEELENNETGDDPKR